MSEQCTTPYARNDTFLFEPAEHRYTVHGKRLPSVTEIVGDVVRTPVYATEWHMDRGAKIHRAIALYLKGTLDEASIDVRIRGRVEAAKKAIRELGIVPKFLETPQFHPTLQYAGTPDVFTTSHILVDWKSSHSPATEIQLGGYALLLDSHHEHTKKCVEIVLNEDGRYTLTAYKPDRCSRLFIATLTIYQWQQTHGGT